MRILHVLESCAPGGIETTFLHVLRAWRAEGWGEHHVLALAGGALRPAYAAEAQTLTVTCAPQDVERTIAGGGDVVYVLFERAATRVLPYALARTAIPVVYGKGYDLAGMARVNDGLTLRWDDSLLSCADAATFTTASLRRRYDAPADRSCVLGKAADVSRFLSLPPPDATTPPRIVCVANLHRRKRLADLVTAASLVRARVPDVRLRLVGEDSGGEAARLAALARQFGLGHACEITGRHEDVTADLAASRVFALPSGCEGVPTAVLEAMAASRPVVVTDVGDVRDVVDDGVEGWVVPSGEPVGLARAIETILHDADVTERMGAAGRRRARQHDVATVAARLRAVLESAARDALVATPPGQNLSS